MSLARTFNQTFLSKMVFKSFCFLAATYLTKTWNNIQLYLNFLFNLLFNSCKSSIGQMEKMDWCGHSTMKWCVILLQIDCFPKDSNIRLIGVINIPNFHLSTWFDSFRFIRSPIVSKCCHLTKQHIRPIFDRRFCPRKKYQWFFIFLFMRCKRK